MPLVHIALRRGYQLQQTGSDGSIRTVETTSAVVKGWFAQAIPGLLVQHAATLGLSPTTPPQGVRVTNSDFSNHDIHTPDILVTVELTREPPSEWEQTRILDAMYEIFAKWFTENDFSLPENFVLQLSWRPSRGRGTVNGVPLAW